MVNVAVLGSTGSVGRNTLEVIAAHPQRLRVAALAARSRSETLEAQISRWAPADAAVWDEQGLDGLIRVATRPDVDLVVAATSGQEALVAVVRAICAGKRIALASKELLVMAGELIMRLVREHGTQLVPIDSEHAAVFQCLRGVAREDVARITITGSGGPLWALSPEARRAATRDQVLTHPKWRMGPKITVDSATLMNKGLEIIEARWLFDVPFDRIRVLIHPEAVVHAMVELREGTTLAQMSPCDMRLPIQYALSYPERWTPPSSWPSSDLTSLGCLTFAEPDVQEFPCLRLSLQAAAAGGTACAALNAANDAAVRAYLHDAIKFAEIPRVIEDVLRQHTPIAQPTLDDVLRVDAWARAAAAELMAIPAPLAS